MQVACRQLGYTTGYAGHTTANLTASMPIYSVACSDSKQAVAACASTFETRLDYSISCRHATVICVGSAPPPAAGAQAPGSVASLQLHLRPPSRYPAGQEICSCASGGIASPDCLADFQQYECYGDQGAYIQEACTASWHAGADRAAALITAKYVADRCFPNLPIIADTPCACNAVRLYVWVCAHSISKECMHACAGAAG